jgi:hypothetical protein
VLSGEDPFNESTMVDDHDELEELEEPNGTKELVPATA